MSSPAACQCLFCNHLNPEGASFCNECGSQLQLQQCALCASINKRSARHCYKCGAPFAAPAPVRVLSAAASAEPSLPESVAQALQSGKGGTVLTLRSPLAARRTSSAKVAERAGTARVGRPPAANDLAARHRLWLLPLLVALIAAAIFLLRGVDLLPAGAGGRASLSLTLPLVPPLGDTVQAVAGERGLPGARPAGSVAEDPRPAADDQRPAADEAKPGRVPASACIEAVAALGLCP